MFPYITLLKSGDLYAPRHLGKRDILMAGGRIAAVEPDLKGISIPDLEIIDLKNSVVIPGLIDGHAHISGAGGEGGPGSRTAGLTFGSMIAAGITSVVGCLGTDGITRNLTEVLMKVKQLNAQGMSAWMYTGSYQVPPPTISGDVARDIALFAEIIGCGEIAIADHRSSYPTLAAFLKIVQAAKLGGLLGGKAGIVNIHLGEQKTPFRLIEEACGLEGISHERFLPTHCNRARTVLEAAKSYAVSGYVDLTTSAYPFFPDTDIKPSEAYYELLAAGVPADHITMSSDAGGSLPSFDSNGDLLKLETGQPITLHHELIDIIQKDSRQFENALRTVTSSIARRLRLPGKGSIRPGFDADLVALDPDTLEICHVWARGQRFLRDGIIEKTR